MATAWKPLATITLGAAQVGVTFSGIPNTYRDLVIVFSGTMNGSNNTLYMQFNGDTGASNYYSSSLEGTSTSTGGTAAQTYSAITASISNNVISGTAPSIAKFEIYDYAQTDRQKAAVVRAGYPTLGTSIAGGRWLSTAAITSVYVFQSTGTFQLGAGSTVSLYGVMG